MATIITNDFFNSFTMNEVQPVEKEEVFNLSLDRDDLRTLFTNYAKHKGFTVFNSKRPFDLNIWGIRSKEQKAGKFDDTLIIWTNNILETFEVTVDPSDIYLFKPIHSLGTAIIKPGQYRNVWKLGYHQNKKDHAALVQRGPITVYRDFNKDNLLDLNRPSYYKINTYTDNVGNIVSNYIDELGRVVGIEHTGMFGINCHRASIYTILEKIGLYSAGCVVHNDYYRYDSDFLRLLRLARNEWGNSFSFTLVTEQELIDFMNHG